MMQRLSIVVKAAFAALVLASSAACVAASYPDHPVRLIVPYPPGGPNDVLARLLGERLTDAWKQQVVVENRAGAGGNIATEAAARSDPDGYTMVLPAMAYAVNPSLYTKVPYAFDDFTAVTIVAKGPLVLVVHPSFEAKSVGELINMAKRAPGKLNFASGGTGSSLHLAPELFKLEAGIDMVHVPYKGTNALLPDLLAGRVPIAFISPLTAEEYVKDGRLRALGVTSKQRAAGWPDVPAIAEAGVPGYEMEAWYALLVPAATPKDVVRQLNTAVAKALASPRISEKLSGLGMTAVGNTPEEAAAYIRNEAAKWAKVARTANIKAD